MRKALFLLPALAATLLAQAPSPSAGPTLKWRGALWASAVTQNRDTADGSLVFRPLEAGQGQFHGDRARRHGGRGPHHSKPKRRFRALCAIGMGAGELVIAGVARRLR